MPNNQLTRDLGTLEYDAGNTVTLDLPKSHFYERLNLVMDYTVTSDGTSGEVGSGILDLIESIEVKFNGSDTIKSTSLAMSHFIDLYQYGTRPIFDAVDHSSASQQSGQVQTFVDFLIAMQQYGAMLPSFAFSDLQLRIKWGTASDVGSDITSVDSASVSVQSKERIKSTVPKPQKGITLEKVVKSLQGFQETEIRKQIDVTGDNVVTLPEGNTYHSIAVLVYDNNLPDNDLVSRVEVEENGQTTHFDTEFSLLRAQDKQQYGFETLPTGFAMLNYGFRGNTDDVVSTKGMDSFEMTLDTDGTAPTAPAEARVVTREIVTN